MLKGDKKKQRKIGMKKREKREKKKNGSSKSDANSLDKL